MSSLVGSVYLIFRQGNCLQRHAKLRFGADMDGKTIGYVRMHLTHIQLYPQWSRKQYARIEHLTCSLE